jgi:hypothetical protein
MIGVVPVCDIQRATCTVVFILDYFLIFSLFEIRKYLVIRPAFIPHCFPTVMSFFMTTDVDHGIVAATPQHFSLGRYSERLFMLFIFTE